MSISTDHSQEGWLHANTSKPISLVKVPPFHDIESKDGRLSVLYPRQATQLVSSQTPQAQVQGCVFSAALSMALLPVGCLAAGLWVSESVRIHHPSLKGKLRSWLRVINVGKDYQDLQSFKMRRRGSTSYGRVHLLGPVSFPTL